MTDAYHAMDIFAFASKSETQGMVLTEAMAAGLPVIALDAPGAREVVEEGANGRLLAEDASAEDFSQSIKKDFLENLGLGFVITRVARSPRTAKGSGTE